MLCLRPYSPEFDPIEQLFAKLKGLIRSAAARTTDTLRMPSARLSTPSREETLRDAIGTALDAIPEAEGRNDLANGGYEFTSIESALIEPPATKPRSPSKAITSGPRSRAELLSSKPSPSTIYDPTSWSDRPCSEAACWLSSV